MAQPRERGAPLVPSADLSAHARELLQQLNNPAARFVLWDREDGEPIELNEEVFEILRSILIDISQNRAIQLTPLNMELTTVQAAEFLNVSRPFLVKKLEQGEISFRMVGTHRRIELGELMKYREAMHATSKELADKMAQEAQELGWE